MTRLSGDQPTAPAQVFQVLAHRLGDVQPAGIVVAAQQQHALRARAASCCLKRRIIAARR